MLRSAGFPTVGAHRSPSARADCALYFAQNTLATSPAAGVRPQVAAAALAALREAGADVLTLTADVTSVEQMTEVVSMALQRFGALHGVVHAASAPVVIRSAANAPRLDAKTHGARVLAQVLADRPLDFLLLCSSTASLLGGVGMAEYAAANAFLDALAHERAARAFPVVSVNWDGWRGVGMAPDIEARYAARIGEALPAGLSVSQALAAFDRIVSLPVVPQVVASASDFTAAARHGAHDIASVAGRIAAVPQHARPVMSTPFERPLTDVERRVAAVWEETLGVAPVGRQDDYSELGGDSLIAIKVVSRLRETLDLELRVAALYDWPTVATLAQHIETMRWAAAPVPALRPDDVEGAL